MNHTANISSGVACNGSTSTMIMASNSSRNFFFVSNNTNSEDVWIKLQPASVDNDKKGIFLSASANAGDTGTGANHWQMPTSAVYTGEICAISASGAPSVYCTEY